MLMVGSEKASKLFLDAPMLDVILRAWIELVCQPTYLLRKN